jgi:hypothetical protein
MPEHHFGVGISSHSLTTLNHDHRFKINFKLIIFLGSQAYRLTGSRSQVHMLATLRGWGTGPPQVLGTGDCGWAAIGMGDRGSWACSDT